MTWEATPWGNISWGDTVILDKEPRPKRDRSVPTESQKRIALQDTQGRRVLSATLLQAFTECQRKFLFKYFEGEVEDDIGAMRLGTRCHSIAESYLRDGAYPDLGESMVLPDRRATLPDGSPKLNTYYPGQIIESGLYLLPAPGIVEVEKSFTLDTPGSSWKGQKDGAYWIELDPLATNARIDWSSDGGIPEKRIPVVLDHKTTSGARTANEPYGPYSKAPTTRVRKGYKGEETVTGLADDIQAILYCFETMVRLGSSHVLARWIYYLTTGQKRDAWASEYLFSAAELTTKMAGLDEKALECHSLIAAMPSANDAEPNTASCDKFGGCPFHSSRGGQCKLSLSQIVNKGKNMADVNDIIAQLKAQQAGGQPTLPTAQPTLPQPALPTAIAPAPIVAAVPAQPQAPYWRPGMPLNAVQQYLKSTGMPWSALAQQADVKPPAEVAALYDSVYDSAGNQLVPGTSPGVINPPEAPHIAPPNPAAMPAVVMPAAAVPTTIAAAVATVAPAPVKDELSDLTDREGVKQYAVSLGCVPANTKLRIDGLKAAIRAHWAGPYGRNAAPTAMAPEVEGTPTPIALTPAVVERVTATVPPGGPTPEELTARFGNTGAKGAKGFVLYVNCIPLKGGQEHATHLDTLLADSGVLEQTAKVLGGLPDYRLADFGKGAGALSASLDAYLTEMSWGANVAIMVDSRHAEGSVCLATLTRHASLVIRGL